MPLLILGAAAVAIYLFKDKIAAAVSDFGGGGGGLSAATPIVNFIPEGDYNTSPYAGVISTPSGSRTRAISTTAGLIPYSAATPFKSTTTPQTRVTPQAISGSGALIARGMYTLKPRELPVYAPISGTAALIARGGRVLRPR
ncbi:MAG: hypothetical protein IMZ49_00415 [Actinobacteria bacterium]|nr:hypothetical protein [Actinomycetota bacterium]